MLSRLEISQSDFDELTAFIKEKYGLDLARKKSIVESRLSNYVLDAASTAFQNISAPSTAMKQAEKLPTL